MFITYTAFEPGSQPFFSSRAGGEGLGDQIRLNAQGGSQGLPPWWLPFREPPGELVRGQQPWRHNILLVDTNGCATEPPTVEALSFTPILELGNARHFFVLRLMVSK